ncbi:hypothetical protein BJN34_0370 (plasmid) [Cupriavidus necator]|uniref:Uncharacterized protein n=1 Tax=Cupriavidus necator TaxID=106590 RepID=A0A2P1DV48_CUPNE|nr:hypothetical protein BJN34_0370 [Cupriavidus necator]
MRRAHFGHRAEPGWAPLFLLHETASDLHYLGFSDKLQKCDALCLKPMPKIRALREPLHLRQAVLASVFNTSLSTVPRGRRARLDCVLLGKVF